MRMTLSFFQESLLVEKRQFPQNRTSHVAVAALSDSAAVVFYDDEATATVQAGFSFLEAAPFSPN